MTSDALYLRTQYALPWALLGALLAGAAFAAAFAVQDASLRWVFLLPAVLFLALPLAFSSLSVAVGPGEARIRFGWIGPRKRIDLRKARAVRPVRNSWLIGWGIRWFPGGWMWNVWGLDAVEIEYRDGRKFRIGTDEPAALARALQGAMGPE